MVNVKAWMYEYIQSDEIDGESIGEFVSVPAFDENAEFEALTAHVLYKNERRSININKGNCKRLSAVFGNDTEKWHHKKFHLRLPSTKEEKASKTKYIIEPFSDA